MKRFLSLVLLLFTICIGGTAIVGCDDNNALEEAGEEIKDAADDVGDEIEDGLD